MSLRNAVMGALRRSKAPQRLYHQVLWRLYGEEPVYTTAIGDRALRFATSDPYSTIWFFSLLRHGGLHEPPVTEAMAGAARAGARVFADVGSHLGYYSCVVAAAAPACDVIAFEMNDELVPAIRANLELNGRPQAEVVHAAVGAAPGAASYSRGPIDPGLKASFDADRAAEAPSSVEVITLDTFFAERAAPDLLKIDVEGAEGMVLRGAAGLLEDHRPVLFLEVHPMSLPQFGSSIDEVLDMVWSAGYDIETFEDHRSVGQPLRPVRGVGDVRENGMLRCMPASR